MRGRLKRAAAFVLGASLTQPALPAVGPHSLTHVSQELIRFYNAGDAAALHQLLAPPLQQKYTVEDVRTALVLCRVLTSEIFRISTPVWGARRFGYFAVYAETKRFEMILEINEDERIIHWVITDDVEANEQQCLITHRQ